MQARDLERFRVELGRSNRRRRGQAFKAGDVVQRSGGRTRGSRQVGKKADLLPHFDDGDTADLSDAVIAIDKAPAAKDEGRWVIAVFGDVGVLRRRRHGIEKNNCKIKYDDGDEAKRPWRTRLLWK